MADFNQALFACADITAADHTGRNALHLAARYGRVAMAEMLVSLGIEVHSESVFVSHALLQVNTAGPSGHTALHFAAQSGNLAMVQLLVDAGADPEQMNNSKRMAFNVAKNEQVIRILSGIVSYMTYY